VTAIALVGLGEIGLGAHLPALRRHSDVRVVALVDPSPARRASAHDQAGGDVPVLQDVEQLQDIADLDAVVLATPPWVTAPLAARLIGSGLYVLAEKPVAPTVLAAAVLEQLGQAGRNRLQVGLTYRHDPALARLREWIRQGVLGSRVIVRAHIYDELRNPEDPDHARRIETTLEYGSPVVHEGAHVFDWLSFLLDGQPQLHDAWSATTRPGLASPNLVGTRLRYPDGTQVLAEFGWLTESQPPGQISVLGERAMAVLKLDTFELELRGRSRTQTVTYPGDRTRRCFDLQLQRFVELARGQRTEPEPDLDDAMTVLRLSERVAEAAEADSARTL
jgi:predicted dehydrogenase